MSDQYSGDRIPPQAVELEMAVLGVLMQEKGSFDSVTHILKAEMFYQDRHRTIFEAIAELAASKSQNDLHLVIRNLRASGQLDAVGGPHYLSELVIKYARRENIEKYSKAIAEKYMLRQVIRLAQEMITSAYDETTDPFELLETGMRGLRDLEPNVSRIEDAEDLALQVIDDVDAVVRGEAEPIYMGFRDIDAEYAFEAGDFIIIAGKSGTGKTAKMMATAKRMRKRYPKVPVVFNSLEMKGKKIVSRDMASSIDVSQMRFRTGRDVTESTFGSMSQTVPNYKGIHFVQCWTHDQLGVKIRQLRKQLGLPDDALVIVFGDYAQIMKGEKGGNREQEVSSISRSGKQLAEQEGIIYFLGSQLNKESGKNRPNASNLRESEALRNDADWVMLLYSPWNNDEKQYEDGSSTKNILEEIFDKVRFGKPGEIIKLHMSDYGLIGDLPRWDDNQQEIGFPDPRRIKPNMDFTIPKHQQEEYEIGGRGTGGKTPDENGGDHFPF